MSTITCTHDAIQTTISEGLQLLHKFNDLPCTKEQPLYINKQHLRLDVVASVFATGHSEDLFAAAFNPQGNEIVLAKNGDPNEADLSFANKFFAFIVQPESKRSADLFAFLLQYRPGALNKRICQIHDAVVDHTFRASLDDALDQLGPDERLEFSRGCKFIEDEFQGRDPLLILKLCQDIISEQTWQAFDENTDLSSRARIYGTIINATNVIAHCNIVETLAFRTLTARKVRMHAMKAYRYLHIGLVFRVAKRRLSSRKRISHRWVQGGVEFIGSGEGEIQLDAQNSGQVVDRWFKGRSDRSEDFLEYVLPSFDKEWRTTLHTSIHPGIRLIFDLGPTFGEGLFPIGLSKRCCLACVSWIESCNEHSAVQWAISERSRRKPDERWAIPGNEHVVGEEPVTSVGRAIWTGLERFVIIQLYDPDSD